MAGIHFQLLAAGLFLLISAALARAQSFQHFPFPVGLMVGIKRSLSFQLQFVQSGFQLLAIMLPLLSQQDGELKLRCRPSTRQCGCVGLSRFGDEPFQVRQGLPRAGDAKIGLLQLQRALAFETPPQPQ